MLVQDASLRGRSKFDWIVDRALPRPIQIWDTELGNSMHFSVLPSLGSLVPGWVLVVPRRPMLNLAALNEIETTELRAFVHHLRNLLSGVSINVFEFEHGAQETDSSMGCGVDQAHLHVVPLPFDLLDAALEDGNQTIQWTDFSGEVDPWPHTPEDHDYLVARDARGRSILGIPSHPTSQWFRKLIARRLERPKQWNYRAHPGIENISTTLEMFGVNRAVGFGHLGLN